MTRRLPTFLHVPSGNVWTVHNLPHPTTIKRWTAGLKATMVNAVYAKAIDREELCRRYSISQEEFTAWWNGYVKASKRNGK